MSRPRPCRRVRRGRRVSTLATLVRRHRAQATLPGVALVALLAVLVTALLAPASAAQLVLRVRPITLASSAGCTTSALTGTAGAASGSATSIVLSGVPAACQGRTARLRLYAADGTALAGADTAVTLDAASSTTVTVPTYAVSGAAGVALTIGTWGVPVTWVVPGGGGPVTPGPGTTFGELQWTSVATSGSQVCVAVPVSGAAGAAWQIDLHLDQRPFNGATTSAGFSVSPGDQARLLSATPAGGVLSVVGQPGRETLQAGQTLTVSVCNWNLPFPVYDPALTYTQTVGAPTGDRWDACLPVTVSVSGTPQFYAGWRTDVDIAPLLDFVRARGGTPVVESVANRNTGGVEVVPQGGTVYRVQPVSGWDVRALRDDTPRALELCVRGT